MQIQKERGLAAVIAACVIWGASFYFGKVALREITADQVVLWRFILALLALAPVVGLRAIRRAQDASFDGLFHSRPQRRDWPLFLLNALLMVPLQFVLQFEGLARTTASSAALIVGAFAPLMALAAVAFARERLGPLGWGAVACSTAGLVVMVGTPGPGRTLTGDLMVLASLLAAVGMVLTTQRLVRRYDALLVTVLGMGMGTLLLLPWSLLVSGWPSFALSASAWGALLGLGLGCTALTFSLWNWGLRHIPASHAGVYVNIEPLIGAVLGIVFLHEALTRELFLGGALILASALLISWPRSVPVSQPDWSTAPAPDAG